MSDSEYLAKDFDNFEHVIDIVTNDMLSDPSWIYNFALIWLYCCCHMTVVLSKLNLNTNLISLFLFIVVAIDRIILDLFSSACSEESFFNLSSSYSIAVSICARWKLLPGRLADLLSDRPGSGPLAGSSPVGSMLWRLARWRISPGIAAELWPKLGSWFT